MPSLLLRRFMIVLLLLSIFNFKSSDSSSNNNVKRSNDRSADGLRDSDAARIVKNIPATTPIGQLSFDSQGLTKIPSGLAKFSLLSSLNLADNRITLISAGDLKLQAKVKSLDLSGNKITSIAPAALPKRYTSGARISLDNNQLTSFDRSVFEPVVNYFIVNKFDSSTTYISFFGNPIDCSNHASDWIAYNSTVLQYIRGAVLCLEKPKIVVLSQKKSNHTLTANA